MKWHKLVNELNSNKKQSLIYKYSEIASRLTGISIPIFGVSWQPLEAERTVIRAFFIFLENKRALFNPFETEQSRFVALSIIEIRQNIVEVLQKVSDSSKATSSMKAMQIACHEYLNKESNLHVPDARFAKLTGDINQFKFLVDLGRLRTIFGYHIAQLSVLYGIDIEGNLVKILPPEYVNGLD